MRTGALFLSNAQEKSTTNAAIFLLLLHQHLLAHGVSLKDSVIQTDNGTEFPSPWNSTKTTTFTHIVTRAAQALHHLIPPGAKTWQSDVGSSHRLIEEELYAAVPFASHGDFLQKAARYATYFNLERYNSYKKGTPMELAKLTYPHISSEVFLFCPVVLDNLLASVKDELAQ